MRNHGGTELTIKRQSWERETRIYSGSPCLGEHGYVHLESTIMPLGHWCYKSIHPAGYKSIHSRGGVREGWGSVSIPQGGVTNGGVYPSRGVECISDIYIPLLHRGSLPFIAKEGSLFLHTSDVGLTIHLHSHGTFLWSLEKHLPGVVPMIFHHGEVAWTSVYKFHDRSMGGEDSFLTTDYKSPHVLVQDTS
ncbi:hypothetical protein ACLB2K_065551 [Fragaria x ananassa]